MTSSNESIFCYWPFVRRIRRWPVDSPHIGQWRGALMFSFICALTNSWENCLDTCDLRRHRAHYNITVMEACKVMQKGVTELFHSCYDLWLVTCYASRHCLNQNRTIVSLKLTIKLLRNVIKMQWFSFKKTHCKMTATWRPHRTGLDIF